LGFSFALLVLLVAATAPNHQGGVNAFVLPQSGLSLFGSNQRTKIGSSSGLFHLSNVEDQEEEEDAEATTTKSVRPEYAALSPGTIVKIQVGDVSLSRKAWKKRRRSGSPLLVPCSVLDMDRESMVRWNILYLIQKFGAPLKDLKNKEDVGFTGKGVALSWQTIAKLYKQHLGSSLAKHAKAFGYASPRHMVQALFSQKIQKEYGMRVWMPPREKNSHHRHHDKDQQDERPMWLVLPISRHRARSMASETGIVQFATMPEENEEDFFQGPRMRHTGIIRMKNPDLSTENKAAAAPHKFQSLSAAIRVSQKDVDEERIANGSVHHAVVFSYDPNGDNNLPLLTTSLNLDQVKDRLKKLQSVRKHHVSRSFPMPSSDQKAVERNLKDLKVGEGPYRATVVKVSSRSHAVFVDCNVGRNVSKQRGGGVARVMGMLRFDDIAPSTKKLSSDTDEEEDLIESVFDDLEEYDDDEDWDEEYDDDDDDAMTVEDLFSKIDAADAEDEEEGTTAEDISHMFSMDDDGTLRYKDPETGKVTIVAADDDDDEDFFDDEDEEDEEEDNEDEGADAKPVILKVGDEVNVFIKSVSKQSGRFAVTTDPSVQGKKAKDIKRENEAEKKLSKLAKKFGEEGLEKILELEGTECTGTVKATSNTGDWYYVQPDMEDLPVGVAASFNEDDASSISQGDTVRVRLDGIDESRGQIAMTVLEKLAP